MKVSADLYRFIGGLSLDGTGVVIENELDRKTTYVSRHFTSNLTVSKLAVKVKSDIQLDTMNPYNNTSDEKSLLYLLQHSTIAVLYPDIYRYCQAVVLDMYSLVYAYEYDTTLFADLTTDDIENTINNCLYLNDYFSGLDNYTDIATKFSEAVVKLGVVKNYLATIKSLDKETVSAYGTI